MKEKMSKLFETIKANKTKVAIIAASAVVVVGGTVAAIAVLSNKGEEYAPGKGTNSSSIVASQVTDTDKEGVEETASSPPDNSSDVESTVSKDNVSSANTTTSDVSSKEPLKTENVSSKTESKPQKTESQASGSSSTPSKEPVKEPTSSTGNTTNSKPSSNVVQRADPETGISWDGKSPIVYTYPDGTTGTEKREGATYERYPGLTSTVAPEAPKGELVKTCSHCGKTKGHGENGTCVRWLVDGVTCPNCTVAVPANTCHSCGQ